MGRKINASEQSVHIEFTAVCTRVIIRKLIDRIVAILDKMGIQATVLHQENTEPNPTNSYSESESEED